MKWRGLRRSTNVEDRRNDDGSRRPRRRVARGVGGGVGVIAVIAVVAVTIFPETRVFVEPLLAGLQGGQTEQLGGPVAVREAGAPTDDVGGFISVVLRTTEDTWAQIFAEGRFRGNQTYEPPVLVLFNGNTTSPCGQASTGGGPFYCPADRKIYIDPGFYQIMATRLRAPGDFAQAYVIAHEVAHHVQMELGVLMQVNRRRASVGTLEGNRLTVRLELQADCFSGVWANRIEDARLSNGERILEPGDLKEALRAAYQVGDDVIMRMSGRRVDETQFTHGSGEQRSRWFNIGYASGDVARCDTFSPRYDDL